MKRIVLDCLQRKVTDIHFVVEHHNKIPYYKLRYRFENDFIYSDLFDMSRDMNRQVISSLIDKKSGAVVGDLDTFEGVEASYDDVFGDGNISLRIAANMVNAGYHCVCRIQSLSTVSLKIHELGFSKDVEEDLKVLAKRRRGLTLITGGIRTGKNTTAFAIGNDMEQYNMKLMDLSSPTEVLMPFTQLDYRMNPKNLEKAIKLLKKQDVNVVFINEIPNKEVALAIEDLVVSGIHVITTTHVERLWHLPQKLFIYFGENFRNILTQMNICVNQKMYVKQCSRCGNKAPVSDLPSRYRTVLEKFGTTSYYINEGCSECKDGKLEGKVQPHVERLVFNDELIETMLEFDKPFLMERHIRKHMFENNLTLETSLCKAIGEGKLQVDSLDSII